MESAILHLQKEEILIYIVNFLKIFSVQYLFNVYFMLNQMSKISRVKTHLNLLRTYIF